VIQRRSTLPVLLMSFIGLLLLFVGAAPQADAEAPMHRNLKRSRMNTFHEHHASSGIIGQVAQLGGASLTVAVQGSYAYLGVGSRLVILDVADPAQPRWLGHTASVPGVVEDVKVAGDYAYMAVNHEGLYIFNVSNPAAPEQVSYFETRDAKDIALRDNLVYLVGGALIILDVSNPASPVQVGSYRQGLDRAQGVAVAGDYAYVANDTFGLHVINVSNPANPQQTSRFDSLDFVYDVTIVGDYAYVAAGPYGLRLIDISDPARLFEVSFYGYGVMGAANEVVIRDDYAYVAYGVAGLRVVNIADPANPFEVSSHDPIGNMVGIAVAGGVAYVADLYGGLHIVDVGEEPILPPLAFYKTPGNVVDVVRVGDYAYLAASSSLGIVNVADAFNPVHLSTLGLSGYVRDVTVSGNYAYVATVVTGVYVIDVSNPTAPVVVAQYDTPGRAGDLFVAENYLFVADGDGGLLVLDVSDPTHPNYAGVYNSPGTARAVTVAGDYAYLADGTEGLRIVDVSKPTNPVEVGVFDSPSRNNVAVAGNYAYVTGPNVLQVIDISNPAAPVEVGSINQHGQGITVQGNLLYLTDSWDYFDDSYDGLYIYDISTPTRPTQIAFSDTPGISAGVYADAANIYVADERGGLSILRYIPEANLPFHLYAPLVTK
jgi:hypothetical protein